MIRTQHLAAALGFAFVAAWIAWSFGSAILCLVGAAVFYLAIAFQRGELDLAELQARVGQQRPSAAAASPSPPMARPRARVR